MPRYRLRYKGSDFELPPAGPFVVGRSSTCSLALDDPLVSRRHASIEVRDGTLWVEDLGSRNGVLVNGEKVHGARSLAHLDRVTVGAHDFIVHEVGRDQTVRCDACGTVSAPAQGHCPRCGANVSSRLHQTLVGSGSFAVHTVPQNQPPSDEESTVVGSVLSTLAAKAIALGRFDEAERLLGRFMGTLLERSRRGDLVAPVSLQEATAFALKLAEGTKKTEWIDWIFEVHAASGAMLSPNDVESLHEIVRRIRYANVTAIRSYLTRLEERSAAMSAAQRFQLQRLEGLLRVVSA